jgi:uncharacterized protein (DUF1684 family)
MDDPRATLALWEYRRLVADLYAEVRALPPQAGWRRWRRVRDELFGSHSQSPLSTAAGAGFGGLVYYDYNPAMRFEVSVEPAAGPPISIPHSGTGSTPALPLGTVRLPFEAREPSLTLYWLESYGGGVFLPFADATSGTETYGGGRYLLDTAKGADLGHHHDLVILDFNFAFHPSCAHDPRWSCPLSPPANRLPAPIRAGERLAPP